MPHSCLLPAKQGFHTVGTRQSGFHVVIKNYLEGKNICHREMVNSTMVPQRRVREALQLPFRWRLFPAFQRFDTRNGTNNHNAWLSSCHQERLGSKDLRHCETVNSTMMPQPRLHEALQAAAPSCFLPAIQKRRNHQSKNCKSTSLNWKHGSETRDNVSVLCLGHSVLCVFSGLTIKQKNNMSISENYEERHTTHWFISTTSIDHPRLVVSWILMYASICIYIKLHHGSAILFFHHPHNRSGFHHSDPHSVGTYCDRLLLRAVPSDAA